MKPHNRSHWLLPNAKLFVEFLVRHRDSGNYAHFQRKVLFKVAKLNSKYEFNKCHDIARDIAHDEGYDIVNQPTLGYKAAHRGEESMLEVSRSLMRSESHLRSAEIRRHATNKFLQKTLDVEARVSLARLDGALEMRRATEGTIQKMLAAVNEQCGGALSGARDDVTGVVDKLLDMDQLRRVAKSAAADRIMKISEDDEDDDAA